MDGNRYWFRRKRIGWGLEPGSREGLDRNRRFVAVEVGGSLPWSSFWALAPIDHR